MGLRINTSLLSLSAQRSVGKTQLQLSKTLERLASGFRINRAADDAAGMAISEKLQTQVEGLRQAGANTQDAVNLSQTADGALSGISDMLQRMRELALQSANGTLAFSDREKIQLEIDQLTAEIDRVARTTDFNSRKLLDGSLSASKAEEIGRFEIIQSDRIGDVAATIPALKDFARVIGPNEITGALATVMLFEANPAVPFDNHHYVQEWRLVSRDTPSTGGIYGNQDIFLERTDTDSDPIFPPSFSVSLLRTFVGNAITISFTHKNQVLGAIEINLGSVTLTDVGKSFMFEAEQSRPAVTLDNSLVFQVGANQGQFVRLGLDDVTSRGLRLEGLNLLHTTDRGAYAKAQNVINTVDDALDRVNSLRARLGAFQNRLDNTLSSLSITEENLASSRSRIKDADVAYETAQLTRLQILQQAGTAVLAQANVSNQSALSLLQ